LKDDYLLCEPVDVLLYIYEWLKFVDIE
jgi:hypothetical protein